MANIQITEINDVRQLAELRPAWQRLWHTMPSGSFFHSCQWLEAIWDHAAIQQSLRVVVVGELDRPLGILPLVVRHEPRRLHAARVLSYPLDDWGPYYGPISDQPAETLRAGLAYVLHTRRDWDIVDLRWTAPAAQDHAQTLSTLSELGLKTDARVRHQTSIIDLNGTWDEYVKNRSKNWRSHFRRRHKRFVQAGEVRYERYRPLGHEHKQSDPRWDLYDTCVQLAAKSWQGSSTTGNTLSHAAVRDLLRAVHEQAAHLGCLDLNLVYLDDRPVSFAYNYVYQGHVFALRLGYDRDLAKLGPGNYVEELAIQDSFARGDHLYELGPDAEESKRQLRTRLEPIWQYTHYPRCVRSQLMRCKAVASSWTQNRLPGKGKG